jgi:hypothetical protein
MDAIIWIVFLVGAPALLYWMWNSNRQRREHWRAWCRQRDWRIEIDNEGASGVERIPGLPALPIDQSHRRRQSFDLVGRGRFRQADAATGEWNTAWRNMPAKGRGATISNKLHAIALHLPASTPAPFCLLPPAMALLSVSGMLSLPRVDPVAGEPLGHWAMHARDPAIARDWIRAHMAVVTDAISHAPADLAVLQVEGDWIIAWHLGETRLDRIEPTLAWLSKLAGTP